MSLKIILLVSMVWASNSLWAVGACRSAVVPKLVTDDKKIAFLSALERTSFDFTYERHRCVALAAELLLRSEKPAGFNPKIFDFINLSQNQWTPIAAIEIIQQLEETYPTGQLGYGFKTLLGLSDATMNSTTDFAIRRWKNSIEPSRFIFLPEHNRRYYAHAVDTGNKIRSLIPAGFESNYDFLTMERSLSHRPWRDHFFRAILLQGMLEDTRGKNLEQLLVRAGTYVRRIEEFRRFQSAEVADFFGTRLDAEKDAFISALIAFLSSPNTVSTDHLRDWHPILNDGRDLGGAELRQHQIRSDSFSKLREVLKHLDTDEIEHISRTAELVRIVFANPFRGVDRNKHAGAMNNAGHKFQLDETGQVYLQIPGQNRVYPPPDLQAVLYNFVARGNLRFVGPKNIEVPLYHLDPNVIQSLNAELHRRDFFSQIRLRAYRDTKFEHLLPLSTQVASLYRGIVDDILAYPPEMVKGARIVLVAEPY